MSQENTDQMQQPCAASLEDSSQVCTSMMVAEEEGKTEEAGELQSSVPIEINQLSPVDAGFGQAGEHPGSNSNCDGLEEEDVGSLTQELESVSSQLHTGLDPGNSAEGELESSVFSCEHCERHFSTKQGLERHTHIHVSVNRRMHTFKCRYCSKPFGSQVGRRRHERRHENGPMKKMALVSGPTKSLRQLSSQSDSSGPDPVANSDSAVVNGFPSCVNPKVSSSTQKVPVTADTRRAPAVDDSGESKGLHPCKYCKKVFGTHTNMRRHQRRIHERHLLPKGIRKNGTLLQEIQLQKQPPPEGSPDASPPPVYVPSGDVEDEGGQEEYMVDISNNISENLSLYIDGKILSTSTVSNCEVIQVDSSSVALFGLDAFIISPDQISQVLKVDTAVCTVKEIPAQPVSKRRTATPPLPPNIKTELDSIPVISSLSSPSSSPSSSSSVIGTSSSQPTETLAFQKEKTLYLSPKLKQLLQTRDGYKPTSTLLTDGHRPGPPPPMAALSAGSGRFKRRTASPPNSSQYNPVGSSKSEAVVSLGSKAPKIDNQGSSPTQSSSKDERDTASPSGTDPFKLTTEDWPNSRSVGSSCNQQPLDLSSAVSKKDEGQNKGPGEIVLDLSMHRKTSTEPEVKGSLSTQPLLKKRKPDTSVLEKVLLNEYDGLEVAVEENAGKLETSPGEVEPTTQCSPDSHSHNSEEILSEQVIISVTRQSPPPSLTPVTMHSPSPCSPAVGSPTPPPPVLPSASSPQPLSESTELQSSSSPTQKSLPDLSPNISPRPLEINQEKLSPVSEQDTNVMVQDVVNCANLYQLAEPLSSSEPKSHTFLTNQPFNQMAIHTASEYSLIGGSSSTAITNCNISSFNVTHRAVVIECTLSIESSQNLVSAPVTVLENPPTENLIVNQEAKLEEQPKSHSHTPPHSLEPPVHLPAPSESAVPSVSQAVTPESLAPSMPPISGLSEISEADLKLDDPVATSADPPDLAPLTPPSASDRTSDKVESLQKETFSKSFMCNVCEKPFCSIKELSHHISEHAEEWPFKCEFCVLLFGKADALLEHRSSLHGVGRIYICSACSKEFAYLCNLQQHQKDLHPGQNCTYTEVENGKLRPQNHNGPVTVNREMSAEDGASSNVASDVKKEDDLDDSTEELYTTIKIMASEGGKPKGPNVRLGINQHYPSFKPPPFPYHNRTPAGSVTSATNFTTHNIPQTFTTAIRCTKCGRSFDNMPELHKHILACANASDKKRYTPKKNPIPLKEFAKAQNGVLSPTAAAAANAGQNTFRRMGLSKRLNLNQDPSSKVKLNALIPRKNQLAQKAILQRNKQSLIAKRSSVKVEEQLYVCPHCNREFTYRGSLNKHVALSCSMKPVSRKSKKVKAGSIPVSQDRNGNLRRRTADSEIKQQGPTLVPKTLGKTRARSSGPGTAVPLKPQPSKGKMAVQTVQLKRPTSLPAALVPFSKKSKATVNSNAVMLQPSPALPPVLPPVPMRSQRGEPDPPKRLAEGNLPAQPKKEERLAVMTRMRSGGPVTRSLQLANSKAPAMAEGEMSN